MDRAYLLHRHDEELAKARAADCDEARQAHEMIAQAFLDATARLDPPKVVPPKPIERPTA